MRLETKCRICGQPVTVDVDMAYAGVGDPYKLIAASCHDRCLDIYNAKRAAGRVLYRCCLELLLKPKEKVRLRIATQIVTATRRYARALADQQHAPVEIWDEALPEQIIKEPEHWRKIMADYTARALAEFRRPRVG